MSSAVSSGVEPTASHWMSHQMLMIAYFGYLLLLSIALIVVLRCHYIYSDDIGLKEIRSGIQKTPLIASNNYCFGCRSDPFDRANGDSVGVGVFGRRQRLQSGGPSNWMHRYRVGRHSGPPLRLHSVARPLPDHSGLFSLDFIFSNSNAANLKGDSRPIFRSSKHSDLSSSGHSNLFVVSQLRGPTRSMLLRPGL